MTKRFVIYADVCCINRPLDDLQQPRVRLEAEAMLAILQKCEVQTWSLLSSDALHFEVSRNTDASRQEQLEAVLSLARRYIFSTSEIEAQAQELVLLGFKLYDALHIASAQAVSADVFLTTDDRLLKRAKKHSRAMTISVENPVIWLMSVLQEENQNNETG